MTYLVITSVLFALAAGWLLARSYSAFVLVPSGLIVIVAAIGLGLVANGGYREIILSIALGLIALDFGYLLGLAAARFAGKPDAGSRELEKAFFRAARGGAGREELSGGIWPSTPARKFDIPISAEPTGASRRGKAND